jgi:hypothetical protein
LIAGEATAQKHWLTRNFKLPDVLTIKTVNKLQKEAKEVHEQVHVL